jgi:hypothetical protein
MRREEKKKIKIKTYGVRVEEHGFLLKGIRKGMRCSRGNHDVIALLGINVFAFWQMEAERAPVAFTIVKNAKNIMFWPQNRKRMDGWMLRWGYGLSPTWSRGTSRRASDFFPGC